MSTTIVIHPGECHRDELVACGLIMASAPKSEKFQILRRDPTAEELNDPSIWVVDCGRQHDPSKHNFDHHQDRNLPAAFRLVAQHLEIDHLAKDIYPWWEFASRCDTDLFGAFRSVGLEGENGFKTVDPMSGFITKVIEAESVVPQLWVRTIRGLGMYILEYLTKVSERLVEIGITAQIVEIGGLKAIISTIKKDPTLGMQIWRQKNCPDAAISISPDDRGNGWSLFRYNDHPRVHFDLLAGNEQIVFAHNNGFIAKTKEITLEEAVRLCAKAVLGNQGLSA